MYGGARKDRFDDGRIPPDFMTDFIDGMHSLEDHVPRSCRCSTGGSAYVDSCSLAIYLGWASTCGDTGAMACLVEVSACV